MCGIVGILSRVSGCHSIEDTIALMADTLAARGPDSSGYWIDPTHTLALGHRRLSILDLSTSGNQPFHSHCGRYVLVYNGEIYNRLELRSQLEAQGLAPPWRGTSDTEILISAFSAWGLIETLQRSRGMFAIALWDRAQHELILVRDRIGEKPIYYGFTGHDFVFASQLKAIRAHPASDLAVDHSALSLMIRHGYVPAPYSIYRNIYKLRPGYLLRVRLDCSLNEPEPWWDFSAAVHQSFLDYPIGGVAHTIDELDNVLSASIADQIDADVPIGALLSGGIDSSIVVALMQKLSNRPVRTFTVGFNESDYDESRSAMSVSKALGTDHTELFVNSNQALELIPRLPDIYDEPFADSSQVPTILISSLTKQHVTVCLSGDGGDELFAGYNRYLWASKVWRRLNHLPFRLRRLFSLSIYGLPASFINYPLSVVNNILPHSLRVSNPTDKFLKLISVLSVSSPSDLYFHLISQWHGKLPLIGISEPTWLASDPARWPLLPSLTECMMAVDTLTYLPDDILVKLDRASMYHSLEMRVPFLDPRVISFAWKLPLDQKIRYGQGKWLLRELLHRYLPKEIMDRPKQGFAVPIDLWLRGPLRDWAEDLLSPASLSLDSLLDPRPIRKKWDDHMAGKNNHHALWNILMYQSWRMRWA